MRRQIILISCYNLLLLLGGLIGYFTAYSLASLVSSATSAALLGICTYFIATGKELAYTIALFIVGLLSLFFAYRFFESYRFIPAGMMALISCLLLAYLVIRRNESVI